MTHNEIAMRDTVEKLYTGITNNRDNNTVSILGHIITNLDPTDAVFNFKSRRTPVKYCNEEIKWYNSKSLSVKGYVDHIKIWRDVSSEQGLINSNYGWCVYSPNNYSQLENALLEISRNKFSRRAIMIYNRPSMWLDHNKEGMRDFMCTLSTQIFIDDNNKLQYIINQRSLDFYRSGLGSDFYWHCYAYTEIFNYLRGVYEDLLVGSISWMINSCHVYREHYDKIISIREEYLAEDN